VARYKKEGEIRQGLERIVLTKSAEVEKNN
jgi:hypothetical protein